ncbi:MAG TPA: transcription elongation factor GreA [Candidatus Saccharibacteria bacterium]|nr:transcription elongation factor GreA [Candidatus Saccharibacteria bacterium]
MIMKKQYQITAEGKKELELELEELKAKRGDVAEKIANARDFGDLSENAEYDAAREEQGLLETRIAEIEDILSNAEIIKGGKRSTIGLGSTVDLKVGSKQITYIVVGSVEADPLEGKISNESPIGVALLGKKEGDSATISTPRGDVTYKIVGVR